ncbi:hypothetical protein PtA15_1A989 [Puccinia triticina]|uniref:Uncharacterized protein n=1 Tax=Puccinia triticina TaxID=208348 RepID=A0ABY7CCK0_9BASI|nr:uncharacterized protein PtA15_1A989 [Puccinia triticina]WAQ81647.1 hypothetical protein PtA15_1A989 [Puccinia triticina]
MRPPTFAQGHTFSQTCPQPLYHTSTTGSQQICHNGQNYQQLSADVGYQNSNHSSSHQSPGQLTSYQQTNTPYQQTNTPYQQTNTPYQQTSTRTTYSPVTTANHCSTDPATTYRQTGTYPPHPNFNHRPTNPPAPTYNYSQGSSTGTHSKPTPPNHVDLSNDSPSPESTTRTGYYVFPDYPSIDHINNLLQNPNLSFADRFLLEAA